MTLTKERSQHAFGFVIGRSVLGHHKQTKAIFTCVKCQAICEVTPRFPLNPEAAAHAARRLGWAADGYRKSAARCQSCLTRSTTSEIVPMPDPTPRRIQAVPDKPREATQTERLHIRALLDKTFDDGVGSYLSGYSDEKVAEELKVPRIFVERIREAAYGPIRVDPELAAIKQEMAGLLANQRELAERLAALAKRVEARGA